MMSGTSSSPAGTQGAFTSPSEVERLRAEKVALAARAEQAEAERDEWKRKCGHANRMKQRATARVELLEAQVERSLNWREYDAKRDAEVVALSARVERLTEALRHYANEEHWSADASHRVYTTFTYDGGEELPWTVASEALGGAAVVGVGDAPVEGLADDGTPL